MLAFGIGCLLVLWGASPEIQSLAEVWQKEVIQGDVQSAAESYEKLYLSAPSQGLRPEARRKAALRAGICFEKLGHWDNAKLAYESLLKMDASPDVLSAEAKLRLQLYSNNPAALPLASTPFSEASVDVAIQHLESTLGVVEKERDETLQSLARNLEVRRERALEARDLLHRLLERGASPSFLEAEEAPLVSPGAASPEWVTSLKEVFRHEGDLGKVQSALASRYLERALVRLGARNWLEGARHLERALALLHNGLTVNATMSATLAEWLRSLIEKRFDADQLSAKAQRLLLESDLTQRSALRREIYDFLKGAELAASDRGRADLVVQHLDQLRDLLDWTRPSLREDPEIRSLSLKGLRLLLYLGGKSGQEQGVIEHWQKARGDVEKMLALSESHADVSAEEIHSRAPASRKETAGTLTACRAEIERLLSTARDALTRGDSLGLERSLRDARVLLGWVPEIDPLLGYQRQLDSLQVSPLGRKGAGVK